MPHINMYVNTYQVVSQAILSEKKRTDGRNDSSLFRRGSHFRAACRGVAFEHKAEFTHTVCSNTVQSVEQKDEKRGPFRARCRLLFSR